ncbi:MAG: SIMPL domain-containing protein [Candidatus Kaiserbacteria bacterium]|nr:SIMPL domain-containing protein [Candidatus Kaiserbacteria bacterium]
MEQQSVRDIITATHWPRTFGSAALAMLALFLLLASLGELKGYRYIGSGVTATNTITVSGEGIVYAVPDTGEFSFSVMQTGKDVTTAQTQVNTKANDIIDYLKQAGIDEKDIQTTDYSVNPHYEWSATTCPAGGYCPGKQTITGYDVSETLTVKVRDTKKAGDLLSGVGSRGATNVSGLNFTVANQDLIEAQARDKAIQAAKDKANTLARSLGVSIVRVVGFDEGGNNRIYYAKSADVSLQASGAAPAPAPEIAVGQNKVVSDVTVTYEIR